MDGGGGGGQGSYPLIIRLPVSAKYCRTLHCRCLGAGEFNAVTGGGETVADPGFQKRGGARFFFFFFAFQQESGGGGVN